MSRRYLYKYVEFDQEKLVLDIITKNKIKFSDPSRFNDPFDCSPHYRNSSEPNKVRPDLFARLDRGGLSPAEKIIFTQRAINMANCAFKDGNFNKEAMRAIGVLSLSRTPWNVLMWSHYARHHTGFVVEFQEQTVFPIGQDGTDPRWLVTFEVNYSDERPVIERWDRPVEKEIDKIFMCKSKVWEYEQEERVINYQSGPGVIEYESSLLKSVIAGCRISDDNFELLKASVKQANKSRADKVVLYRAELDDRRYRLNIPNFHRPRPQKQSSSS